MLVASVAQRLARPVVLVPAEVGALAGAAAQRGEVVQRPGPGLFSVQAGWHVGLRRCPPARQLGRRWQVRLHRSVSGAGRDARPVQKRPRMEFGAQRAFYTALGVWEVGKDDLST